MTDAPRLLAAWPDATGMPLSAAQVAALTTDRMRAAGARIYEVVWDGTRQGDPMRGRYLAEGLADQLPRTAPPRGRRPIVEALTSAQRQEVIRDVLATSMKAAGQKWGFSKFTVLMIMRRQGIRKRDQKPAGES